MSQKAKKMADGGAAAEDQSVQEAPDQLADASYRFKPVDVTAYPDTDKHFKGKRNPAPAADALASAVSPNPAPPPAAPPSGPQSKDVVFPDLPPAASEQAATEDSAATEAQPQPHVISPHITDPDYAMHDAKFWESMQNGEITPKTYQSLFAHQDTLGKIGTIFGLIVGGAGSGLLGQPNIALQMMDKTIANDLAAQQHTKENTMNLWNGSLKYQEMLQGADRIAIDKQLADATVARNPSAIAEAEARKDYLNAQKDVSATTGAQNTINLIALKTMLDKSGLYPPGSPARQQIDDALQGIIVPHIQAKIDANNAKAKLSGELIKPKSVKQQQWHPPMALPAGGIHQQSSIQPPGMPALNLDPLDPDVVNKAANGAVDMNKMHQMMQLGMMPGPMAAMGIPPDQKAAATHEAGKLQALRGLSAQYANVFTNLQKHKIRGEIDPQYWAAQTGGLKSRMTMMQDNKYIEPAAVAQLMGSMPNIKDVPGELDDTDEKWRLGHQNLRSLESGATPTLGQYIDPKDPTGRTPLLITPYPNYAYKTHQGLGIMPSNEEAATPKEGARSKDLGGKPIVWKKGRWVYGK